MRRCNVTGKRKYPTRLEADIALATLELREVRHRKQGVKKLDHDAESYLCLDCACWHHRTARRQAVASS